jgi:hypothetical protein
MTPHRESGRLKLETCHGMNVPAADKRPAQSRTREDVRAFGPVDSGERPPHEPPPEGRGGLQFYRVNIDPRRLRRRELAAMVALPAILFLLAVLGHVNADTAMSVAAVFLLMLGLVVFAFYRVRD